MSVESSLAIGGLSAALGAAVALTLEQVRWRLARSRRWDDQRRSCYADFAAAAKRETRICLRIAASVYPGGPRVPALSPADGRPLLEQAADERAGLFEDLLLLGSQAVVTAARGWQERNRDLEKALGHPVTATEAELDQLVYRAGRARDEFFAAARTHLGVAGELRVGTDWTWFKVDRSGS